MGEVQAPQPWPEKSSLWFGLGAVCVVGAVVVGFVGQQRHAEAAALVLEEQHVEP